MNASCDEETEVFVFPASFAQQRLWFLHQLAPGNPFYNVGCALRLTGKLNLAALEQTFNEIVRRHEILRTSFIMGEDLIQAIAPHLTIALPAIDLQHLVATEREKQLSRLITEEFQRPFSLTTAPLLRVTILQLDAAEYVLLLNLHHIIADGWSIGVLVRELGGLYTAFVKGELSPLPELPLQYADFTEWQRQWLQGEVLSTQLAYWRQQLGNLPVLNLPTDKPRPTVPTYQGAKQLLELPHSLKQGLEELSRQVGVTLFTTLLTGFQTLLYHYTGQDDIVCGVPIANRNRLEIEGLIGFFVNTLVLRSDLSGNPTFRELLVRVREVVLGAYTHQDLPFEKLVEDLHPERDLSRNPLFQVSFSLQNTPISALELPDLNLSLLEVDNGSAKLDLEFHFWSEGETLKGQVIYSTDLFHHTTITRMVGHFQTLLEGIVANPEQPLCELPILTIPERQQLLYDWNDTKQENLGNCIHYLFETQVKNSPDAIAVVFETQRLTYRELNIRANQLAGYLQQLGVVPESIVGICVERSVEMIVGVLGILKAGGAYLPLDPTYPQERLSFMLEDAQVSILLTQQQFVEQFGNDNRHFVILRVKNGAFFDNELPGNAQQSQENPNSSVLPDNLAYIIYTSGSTGKPKGVAISHRGLCNLVQAQRKTFNLQPSNRVLQFASLSFDASIFEIVMALATGATLYVAKNESLMPGKALIQLLRDNGITNVTLPPAVLAILPTAELPALQTIICAGEPCSQDIVKRWAGGRRFFNAYGLTEATVWSTVAEINQVNNAKSIIPIGRPIANTEIYILDAQLQPVPIGVVGELYLGGVGLARGYLNRPATTAERFIPHPFNHQQGARLYRTGDLGRYRSDGNIEFLGRIDEQVKIRGFRIELGEIEAVLRQHPAVTEAVVIATEDVYSNQRLIAYVVSNAKSSQLRSFLKEKLPEYTIPSAFVVLDALPLTPNGKVNRRALPAPDNLNSGPDIAPRTPTESALAEIWAQVLNLNRVGIQDNFFDLGGNSLLAVRLIDRIDKQFQKQLPLSTLFLNPTVEGLAKQLSSDTEALPWSPLVAIQPAGKKPPFFCIHPIFGVVFPYYELAYNLGTDQPFYGLQPLGLDGKEAPLDRIEDMAAYYIQALRLVQPEGPYFIGGWSFGGLVAFEMAQQLHQMGHEVALLAIFDTYAPVSAQQTSFWDGLKFIATTGVRYIWSFLFDYVYLLTVSDRHPSEELATIDLKLRNMMRSLGTHFLWNSISGQTKIDNFLPQEAKLRILNELTVTPMWRVYQANSKAVRSYVPQIYPNRLTLFKTSSAIATHQDPTRGWDKLALGGVEINLIPGNHLTMLKKPHVQILTEKLKFCLNPRERSIC